MTAEYRRRHARFPLELAVRYCLSDSPGQILEGRTQYLGDSGLMLVASDPPPRGSAVTLWLVCTDGELRLEGEVVWTQRLDPAQAHIGIKFVPFPGHGFASDIFMREFSEKME